jgi:hypothetical protein
MLDALRQHPLVKRALAAGEERLGEVVGRLLAGRPPVAALETLLGRARGAREAAERAVRSAMGAVNLPSAGDVKDLERRLAELESLIDALSARLADRGGGPGAGGRGGGTP